MGRPVNLHARSASCPATTARRPAHLRGASLVFFSLAVVVGCGGATSLDNDAGDGNGGDGNKADDGSVEAGGNGDGGTRDSSAIDVDCADAGGGASCGPCNPCPVVLNGSDTCTSGACVILCDPGFGVAYGHCHLAR